MRTSLVTLGTVLLVLGAVFFYLPTASTTATNLETGEAPWTGYAAATLPLQLSLASMLIGLLLIIFGFFIPTPETTVHVHNPQKTVYEGSHRRVYHHSHSAHHRRRAAKARRA